MVFLTKSIASSRRKEQYSPFIGTRSPETGTRWKDWGTSYWPSPLFSYLGLHLLGENRSKARPSSAKGQNRSTKTWIAQNHKVLLYCLRIVEYFARAESSIFLVIGVFHPKATKKFSSSSRSMCSLLLCLCSRGASLLPLSLPLGAPTLPWRPAVFF